MGLFDSTFEPMEKFYDGATMRDGTAYKAGTMLATGNFGVHATLGVKKPNVAGLHRRSGDYWTNTFRPQKGEQKVTYGSVVMSTQIPRLQMIDWRQVRFTQRVANDHPRAKNVENYMLCSGYDTKHKMDILHLPTQAAAALALWRIWDLDIVDAARLANMDIMTLDRTRRWYIWQSGGESGMDPDKWVSRSNGYRGVHGPTLASTGAVPTERDARTLFTFNRHMVPFIPPTDYNPENAQAWMLRSPFHELWMNREHFTPEQAVEVLKRLRWSTRREQMIRLFLNHQRELTMYELEREENQRLMSDAAVARDLALGFVLTGHRYGVNRDTWNHYYTPESSPPKENMFLEELGLY